MQEAIGKLDSDGQLLSLLSEDDKKCMLEYLNKNEKFKDLSEIEKLNLMRVSAVFYKAGINVVEARKETQLARLIGSKACDFVKANKNINPNVLDQAKVEETLKLAKKSLIKSIIIKVAILFACALGFAGTIIGSIMSGGVLPLVASIISIVTASIWTGLDGFNLYQSYKGGYTTKKDRMLMTFSTVLMVGIVLVSNLATAGLVSAVISASLTFAWMMMLLYTVYHWRNKKKSSEPNSLQIREGDHELKPRKTEGQ